MTPESLAFDAHAEVGHAGHFLGAAHTLERFRTCFYRPIAFSTANYQRWLRDGGHDAAERAAEVARACWSGTSARRSTTAGWRSWTSTSRGGGRNWETEAWPRRRRSARS